MGSWLVLESHCFIQSPKYVFLGDLVIFGFKAEDEAKENVMLKNASSK